MNKELKDFTNQELLRELAERIVMGKLELETPAWFVTNYEEKGYSPEQIVWSLKNKMGLHNKVGLALTNIQEVWNEKTNPDPLNLNYFIAEVKNEVEKK